MFVAGLALVSGITLLPSCGHCDDPVWESVSILSFLIKDGEEEVFINDATRKSLSVTKQGTGTAVDVNFYSYETRVDGSYFSLEDNEHDSNSKSGLACDDYILRYLSDDIDTIRICTMSKYSKCEGLEFDSLAVYWNGKLVSYGPHNYSYDTFVTITK